MKKIRIKKPDIKGVFTKIKNLKKEDIKRHFKERKERRERILEKRRNSPFAKKMQPVYKWMNRLSLPLQYLPSVVQAAGMQVAQTIINLGIPSGSAQATATMPIIIPLADLLGVTRQTAVFAFQCGDGITNSVIPTYTTLIAMLAAAKVPFQKWLKFAIKITAAQWISALAMTIIATLIGY